jgi:hypothetical protein
LLYSLSSTAFSRLLWGIILSVAQEGAAGTSPGPLRESVLRALTRGLPADAFVLCGDGGDGRPDLVAADGVRGLITVGIELASADPADREPFTTLNRKVAELRAEAPSVERFRPHRLVAFAACAGSLLPPSLGERPRALGLADVESGAWLERLEQRPAGDGDLEELRRSLAPVLAFTVQPRRGLRDVDREERHLARTELDAQQATAATIPVSDVLVLSGPAGSGKTLVLAARARYLAARHPDWRLALLCYNNALVPYLRRLVDGYPNVKVSTFGKFSYGLGHKISLEGGTAAAADLAAARARGIMPILDALLVDEAQDFDGSWIGFAVAALRPGRGGCVLAGDARQALYRDGGSLGEADGLDGRRVSRLALERPYRSTRQILAAAVTTQPPGAAPAPIGVLDGLPVSLVYADTWDEQARAAAWEISQMIKSGERSARDIAVLITQWRGTLRRMKTALEAAGVPYLVVDRGGYATFDPRSPEVKLMTMHAAKGHEFDMVVLFGLEALRHCEDRDASVAFTGMTRARDQLVVTYTRDSPYLDRLARCPEVSGSTWPDDYRV